MAFTGNKRIAGITIKIGADTTKLTDALKQFDRQLDASKGSLKDIDKLLKLNPGNVTLLTQKQKELENSIGKTKERLAELKSVQQDSVSPDDWDKIQREIIETEGNLKSLEKEYENFGSVAKQQVIAAGEKMQAVGNKISAVGQSLTEKITKPIVDGFGKALSITADFDAQMSKVGAISGATGEDFDKLRAKAREMGAETKFSATEAGQAFEYMAMAGWKTDDMLNGIEGIMSLAAASGEELGTTSDIVTDALTAFGNSAEDAGDFADVLAAASSNANTNVSLMGESFKYAAAMAGGMGYNYRDVALALGLMANSGVKAGQAGRGLQNVMKRIAQPTKQSGEAMAYFNLSTINADGSQKSLRKIMQDLRVEAKKQPEALAEAAEAARVLTEEYENGEISEDEYNEGMQGISNSANEFIANVGKLAGAQGLPGLLAILNASDEDFDDLAGAIDNSSGAAKEMADRMNDNLKGQLTILKSQLEELAISIGDVLTPYARKLVGVVQKVVDKFNKLSPKTKKIAVLIGSVAAAIGPLLAGVGGFVSLAGKGVAAFGSVMKFLPAIKGGLTAIAGVLTGPVGIVAGVAAVIAIVLKATGAWDKIKASMIDAWPKIRQGAVDAWEAIKVKFGEFKAYLQTNLIEPLKALYDRSVKPVFDSIAAAFEPVRKSAAATWDVIKGIFNGWNSFGDLKIMLGDLWNELKKFGGKLGKILSETDWAAIGSEAWELVKSAFAPAAEWLKGVFESGMELVKGIDWAAVGTAVWDGVKAVGGWLGNLFSNAWSFITNSIDWAAIGNAVWDGVKAVGGWLLGLFQSTLDLIGLIDWEKVGTAVWDGVKAVGGWLFNLFSNAWSYITTSIDWAAVGMAVWNGVKAVGEWLGRLFSDAWEAIKNIDWAAVGTSIWEGVKSIGTWLGNQFNNAWQYVKNSIDWAAVGTAVWEGIKEIGGWLGGMFSDAWEAVKNIDWAAVGTAIWEGFRSVGTWLVNRFSDAWESIKNIDWAAVGSTIKTKIGDMGAWLKGRFQAAKNGIVNIDWKGIGSRILTKLKNGLSELKDWFAGLFDLSNVHIPTPHFKVTGWGGPFDVIPQIGVDWYRKAYDNPILFTRPTVVNTPYGPKGFGDGNGGEVVLSEARLRQMAGGGTVNNNITINQLPGESSEQLAARVQRVLVRWDQQKKAAYGR